MNSLTSPCSHYWSHFLLPILVLLSLILTSIFLTACSGNFKTEEEKSAVKQRIRLANLEITQQKGYPISCGDVVEVKFLYHSSLSDRMRVRPDGCISLPYLQDIKVAGKTPADLQKELVEKYSRELRNPEITVIVREFAGRQIYIGGDVKAPQMIQMNTPMTALQAIIMAGDIMPSGVASDVLILRSSLDDGAPEAISVDIEAVKEGRSRDVILRSYDIVHVPRSTIANIGDYVELYINRIVPRSVNFPFMYYLNAIPITQESGKNHQE